MALLVVRTADHRRGGGGPRPRPHRLRRRQRDQRDRPRCRVRDGRHARRQPHHRRFSRDPPCHRTLTGGHPMTVTRRSLALASAVLVLSGCGPHKSLDLDIRPCPSPSLGSSPLPSSLVPPAAVPPPVSLPPAPPLVPFLPPPPAPATQAPVTAAPPPAPACPTAASFAVPERAAPLSLPGVPVPGVSVQARTGAFAGAPLSPSSGGLAGPLTTTIAMLPTTTSSAGQQVEAWSVERKDATGTRQSIEVYQLVHASSVAVPPRPASTSSALPGTTPCAGSSPSSRRAGACSSCPTRSPWPPATRSTPGPPPTRAPSRRCPWCAT